MLNTWPLKESEDKLIFYSFACSYASETFKESYSNEDHLLQSRFSFPPTKGNSIRFSFLSLVYNGNAYIEQESSPKRHILFLWPHLPRELENKRKSENDKKRWKGKIEGVSRFTLNFLQCIPILIRSQAGIQLRLYYIGREKDIMITFSPAIQQEEWMTINMDFCWSQKKTSQPATLANLKPKWFYFNYNVRTCFKVLSSIRDWDIYNSCIVLSCFDSDWRI